MSANTYRNLRLFLIVFLTSAFVLGWISYAKGQSQQSTSEKVEQVQDQVQANDIQIDATTATTVGAIGLGGLALVREIVGTKKLKKADDATDRDSGLSFLYMYRLIQTMDAMIPAVSKCLDQPFNSDPMMKDITIRRKLAEDAQSTANYLMVNLNTAVPSMTPAASVIVADAANTQKEQAVVKPAPANNTNTTVGK